MPPFPDVITIAVDIGSLPLFDVNTISYFHSGINGFLCRIVRKFLLQRGFLYLCPPAGVAIGGGGALLHQHHPVAHIGAGNDIVHTGQQPPAEDGDAPGGVVDLLAAVHALHGQKSAAHLQIGQTQLAQELQGGHGPGHGVVEAVPVAVHQGLLLRPGVEALHPLQAQGIAHRGKPIHPLAQAVQQGELKAGLQDAQGQAGEARAGAHVDEPLAPEVLPQGEQGGGVQKVQVGHLVGLGDGGEVHDLVLLQQQTAVLSQPGRCAVGRREAQGGQAGGNTRLHAHTPSPASRAGTPCTRPITRITPQAAASRAMQAFLE